MDSIEANMREIISRTVLFQPVVYELAPAGLKPIGPITPVEYELSLGKGHQPGFIYLTEYEDKCLYMAPGQPTWQEHVQQKYEEEAEAALWAVMDASPEPTQAMGAAGRDADDSEMEGEEDAVTQAAAGAAQEAAAAQKAAAEEKAAAHQAAAQQAAAQQALLVHQVAHMHLAVPQAIAQQV